MTRAQTEAVKVPCNTCRQPRGAPCVLLDGPDGRPLPWPRTRPHAVRVFAAGIAEGRAQAQREALADKIDRVRGMVEP